MRATRFLIVLALPVLGLGTLIRPAWATWPHNPLVNVPLCTAANSQFYPAAVSDGGTGMIVTWQDSRSGSNDIYAQHLLATGVVDPAWPANGRAVCTAANSQEGPAIISDGVGGALVAWRDLRSGGPGYDIYAQHVLASGMVDPVWPVNGCAVCTAPWDQGSPTMVPDGAGGAVVSWSDFRSGAGDDIYAQHVLASGVVDPAWVPNGRAICTATGDQWGQTTVSDGAGGAIVAWVDLRSANSKIYAQRVLASGVVDPAWPVNGRPLGGPFMTNEGSPTSVSDGAGGAIVTWQDYRSGSNWDIYAQRVLVSGALDPAWSLGGAVCTSAGDQSAPTIVSDGAGGAIVTWDDLRNLVDDDIYAQHMLVSGAADPAWPMNGRALCAAAGNQTSPVLVPDGSGGAIVTWADGRTGMNADIYAQRVLVSGAVDAAWPVNGRALCLAPGVQVNPTLLADGAGGAVVAWRDGRVAGDDIYAQRVDRFGQLGNAEPAIARIRDVLNDQGGKVAVEWTPSYLDTTPTFGIAQYSIWRRVPTRAALQAIHAGACLVGADAARPHAGGGLIRTSVQNGLTLYWEYLASQPARGFPGYSYVAATTCDSLPGSNPYTSFMVMAEQSGGIPYWASSPDSGYSVDNLPPSTPQPFTGYFSGSATALHWGKNTEADLADYRLYRGDTQNFVPSPANLVVEQPDTGFVDLVTGVHYYKLAAVDLHGNVSGYALLTPQQTSDVPGALPTALWLGRAEPNPSGGSTRIAYGLPRDARVSLTLHDAAGRLVRRLADGPVLAGERSAIWDGRDEAGAVAPGGLYFYRLKVEGRTLTARLTRIR